MEFSSKKSNSRIQFYSIPPIDSVPLNVVESLAVERLKVLRCMETFSQEYIRGCKDYDEKIHSQLSKCSDLGKSFLNYSEKESAKSVLMDIKRDILSHFILELAYCRTDELSRWFIQQEIDLFKYRFSLEKIYNPKCLKKLMEENQIIVEKANDEERTQIRKHIEQNLENVVIYKTKFLKVMDLNKSGKAYTLKGVSYVVDDDIFSLVTQNFKTNLSHSLSYLRLMLPQLDEDSRLMPILSTLNKRYIGKDYSKIDAAGKISAFQVDGLSKKSFPPCMQKVHAALKREHHLRHWGRMQYGLFLKAIGLPLDESLKFWRSAFQKKVDHDSFSKRYAYSIRHNYGQEGKRISYTPHSCAKIITTNAPQAGDCHGCPFQLSQLDLVVQALRSSGKPTEEQLASLKEKARNHHYQVSCAKYFKIVHGLADDYAITINHPNQYFEESQKILNAAAGQSVTEGVLSTKMCRRE